MWKLSATVQVDAGVSIYGYEEQSDDINYKACLYNKAYTSMLRFPVLEIISSNEENDSTEYMSELFSLIQRRLSLDYQRTQQSRYRRGRLVGDGKMA